MKTGEKFALRLVLIAFVGVVGFTIYLELDFRKSSPHLQPEHSEEEPRHTQAREPQESIAKFSIPKGIPKGVDPNDLPDAESRGATLLTLYCAQCHDLPTPAMHSSSEWPAILRRMQSHLQASKNGMLRHVIMPPKKDWPRLENYLAANAQASLDPLKYDDIDTAPGQTFVATCSQCHTAPSSESHTKSEWPRVVLRMKANMRAAEVPVPAQTTLLQIIDFLQLHSRSQVE